MSGPHVVTVTGAVRRARRAGCSAVLSLLGLLSVQTCAHELPGDRLTVVQREPAHLALTFRIDDLALMKRLIAPGSSDADFFMPLSTMDDAAFGKTLARARMRFESGVVMRDTRGRALTLTRWRWPSVDDVRRRIRTVVMQSVVGDGAHTHMDPVEITVDALSASAVDGVGLTLPAAAEDIVVVSYRPVQQDYRAGRTTPLRIGFGAALKSP